MRRTHSSFPAATKTDSKEPNSLSEAPQFIRELFLGNPLGAVFSYVLKVVVRQTSRFEDLDVKANQSPYIRVDIRAEFSSRSFAFEFID